MTHRPPPGNDRFPLSMGTGEPPPSLTDVSLRQVGVVSGCRFRRFRSGSGNREPMRRQSAYDTTSRDLAAPRGALNTAR